MKQKAYSILQRIYGIGMFVSFFAGGMPLILFIVAIIVGQDMGETIAVFLYEKYYPCIIILASFSILVGLVALYIGKEHDFSLAKLSKKKEDIS